MGDTWVTKDVFAQTFKNNYDVKVLLSAEREVFSLSDERARFITAGKAMQCRVNSEQIRPFHFNDSQSF